MTFLLLYMCYHDDNFVYLIQEVCWFYCRNRLAFNCIIYSLVFGDITCPFEKLLKFCKPGSLACTSVSVMHRVQRLIARWTADVMDGWMENNKVLTAACSKCIGFIALPVDHVIHFQDVIWYSQAYCVKHHVKKIWNRYEKNSIQVWIR